MKCNRNFENSLQLVEQRNQRYMLQSCANRINADVSQCKSYTKKRPSPFRPSPFPDLVMRRRRRKAFLWYRRGVSRRSNTEKRGFVIHVRTISPVPGSRAHVRVYHLRSLTLTFFLRVTVAPAKSKQHDCLSLTACSSRAGDASVASTWDDQEAKPRLSGIGVL